VDVLCELKFVHVSPGFSERPVLLSEDASAFCVRKKLTAWA